MIAFAVGFLHGAGPSDTISASSLDEGNLPRRKVPDNQSRFRHQANEPLSTEVGRPIAHVSEMALSKAPSALNKLIHVTNIEVQITHYK